MKTHRLARTLGLLDATSIGIGAIMGAGIFVILGLAAGMAGPAIFLSIIISAVAALLTALSYAELSTAIPKEGGVYSFAREAISPLAGFMTGWLFMFGNIVAGSTVAIGFAGYLSGWLPSIPVGATAALVCLIATALNLRSVKGSSAVNNAIVGLKLAVLLAFVFLGLSRIGPENYAPFMPGGLGGVLGGASLFFFAYGGFGRITTVAEEVKEPKRTLPQAILLAIGISTAVYVMVGLVAVGVMPYNALSSSGSPIADASRHIGGADWLVPAVILGALLSTFGVVLTSVLGVSRVFFAMARDGGFPESASEIHGRFQTPHVAVIATGLVMSAIAYCGNLRAVAEVSSFALLFYYAMSNIAALRLRGYAKLRPTFRTPLYPLVPVLGLLSCLVLLFFLGHGAWIMGASVIVLGLAYHRLFVKRPLRPA